MFRNSASLLCLVLLCFGRTLSKAQNVAGTSKPDGTSITATDSENISNTPARGPTEPMLNHNVSTSESTASMAKDNVTTSESTESTAKHNITTSESTDSTAKHNATTSESTESTAKHNVTTSESTDSTAKHNVTTSESTDSTAKQNLTTSESTKSTAKQNQTTPVSTESTHKSDTTTSVSTESTHKLDTTTSTPSTPSTASTTPSTPSTPSTTPSTPSTPSTTPSTPSTTTEIPITPQPGPQKGSWKVIENGSPCIIIEGAFSIDVVKSTTKAHLDVPPTAGSSGSCSGGYIALSWGQNSLVFHFQKKDDKYNLKSFSGSVNIPSAEQIKFNSNNNETHFETPIGQSYSCASMRQVVVNDQVKVTLNDFHLQAFKSSKTTDFDSSVDCNETHTPDIVPIVVGCVLALLVIAVLVAYLISRRRSLTRGYLSM